MDFQMANRRLPTQEAFSNGKNSWSERVGTKTQIGADIGRNIEKAWGPVAVALDDIIPVEK
jgi:hypothetical protein